MAYSYDPIFAVDPNAPSNVARNASILIFDPNDATKAPVTLTDVTGSPVANPITVNQHGFGPAIKHATLDRLAWEGAGMSGVFTSYEGMKEEAVAARVAAQTAATSAGAAAQAELEARIASGEFKGEPGADGSNVLPTDAAIKNAITTPGTQTEAALSATYATKAALAALPTPGAEVFTTETWQVGGKPPVYPRMTTITTFGSSSISGLASALPTTFTPLGVTIANRAQAGERWEHTLARNGIVPARITFPANTVQASGDATVTTTLPTTFALLAYRGTLAGTSIVGRLSLTGGVFTFTRETAGAAVVLTGPVDFLPTPTASNGVAVNPSYRDTVAILDLGKNNADDPYTADAINAAMDSLVSWLVPMVKRYLILGLFANTGSNAAHKANIAAVNAHRAAIGGDKYLDIQAYVTGTDVWTHTGITATSTDLAQQAAGEKPDSLSMDSGHLTSAAWNAFIKHVIVPKLSAFGWYTFPDLAAGLKARWDASTLAVADGGAVSSWPTSAGEAFTLDQKPSTAYAYPTMSATGGPSGGKALQFSRTAFSYIGSNVISPAIGQPFTYLALVKTTIGGVVMGGSTSSVRIKGTATQWITSGAPELVVNSAPTGGWQVVALVANGATSNLTVDGTTDTGTMSTSLTNNRLGIGGVVTGTTGSETEFLDGHLAEVALWTRALSSAEIAAAVADVRQRHGL